MQTRRQNDSASQRSLKRKAETTCNTEDNDSSYDEEINLSSKSFYGSSKSHYLTPLERKNLKESSPKTNMIPIFSAEKRILKGKSVSRERRSSKESKQRLKSKTLQLRNIKSNEPQVKQVSTSSCITSSPLKKVVDEHKKFFRNRSPRKRARKGTTSVMMKKGGFDLKFSPGSLPKKQKSENKPLMSTTMKCSKKLQPVIGNKLADISSSGVIGTNLQQKDQCAKKNSHELLNNKNGLSFETEDSVESFTSLQSSLVSDASTPDSVALLSEIASENSSVCSPEPGKRLFPIFSGSPRVQSTVRKALLPKNPVTPNQKVGISVLKNSPSSLKNSPSSRKLKDDPNQLILDAGQKLLGATCCEMCGMTYSVGEAADETMHLKFHARFMNALKFPGWKKERVVQHNADGSRIIMVLPEDKFATKKVDQIKQIVDEDLGFVVGSKISSNSKVFLYISEDKQVTGFCLAQIISKGYRVISDEDSQQMDQAVDHTRPWCCSTEPEPAKCGINRIWVLKSERQRGIASKLLDSVRFNFIMGRPLTCEDIAFSDPTPDGKTFATKYTRTANFLVYKNA